MHKVFWILGSVIILAGIISPLSIVICGMLGLILIVSGFVMQKRR